MHEFEEVREKRKGHRYENVHISTLIIPSFDWNCYYVVETGITFTLSQILYFDSSEVRGIRFGRNNDDNADKTWMMTDECIGRYIFIVKIKK